MKYIIGVDIGTSGCKAALVNERMELVATSRRTYAAGSAVSLHPGWVDQDPLAWFDAVLAGIAEVSGKAVDGDVVCISYSAQMHGLVALDKDGKLLRPCITCNDGRTEPQCQEIYELLGGPVAGRELLLKCTNNYMFPSFTATKLLWMKRYEPELFEKIAYALNPKDYIRYLMSGNICTDVSDACGFGLFDCRNNEWSREVVEAIGLPMSLLPPVVESDAVVGKLLPEYAEKLGLSTDVLIVAGGGDAVTQTTGCGAVDPGVFTLTLGTGAVVGASFMEFKDNPIGTAQMFRSNSAGRYMAFGGTGSGCSALCWLEDTMFGEEKAAARQLGCSVYELMSAEADMVAPGSDGLMFYPQLVGQRCPYEDAGTRGSFIGLRPFHQKKHFARSLMEGIALCLADNYDVIRPMCGDVELLSVTGGGAASDVWCGILADVFGKTVIRNKGFAYGGAIGACMIGGCGAGIWQDLSQAAALQEEEKRFEPDMARHEIYSRMLAIYKKFYISLKDIFADISKL